MTPHHDQGDAAKTQFQNCVRILKAYLQFNDSSMITQNGESDATQTQCQSCVRISRKQSQT